MVKETMLNFRCSFEEKKIMTDNAKKSDMTLSDYIIACTIKGTAVKATVTTETVTTVTIAHDYE